MNDGLIVDPRELFDDFENVVNRLGVPCGSDVVDKNDDLIVRSSFWYINNECERRGLSKESLNSSSEETLRHLSHCIHGHDYRDSARYNQELCNQSDENRGLDEEGNEIPKFQSYCNRLRNFNAVQACFKESN